MDDESRRPLTGERAQPRRQDDYELAATLLHAAGVTPSAENIIAALRPRPAPDSDSLWAATVLEVGRAFGVEGDDCDAPDTVRPRRLAEVA